MSLTPTTIPRLRPASRNSRLPAAPAPGPDRPMLSPGMARRTTSRAASTASVASLPGARTRPTYPSEAPLCGISGKWRVVVAVLQPGWVPGHRLQPSPPFGPGRPSPGSGRASVVASERSLLSGVAAFRWAPWGWMVAVVVATRGQLLPPLASGGAGVGFPRRDARTRPFGSAWISGGSYSVHHWSRNWAAGWASSSAMDGPTARGPCFGPSQTLGRALGIGGRRHGWCSRSVL